MPTSHTIRLGECIGSLTKRYGFADHKRIHDDPANATLKGNRPNPNVLAEGDVVVVPDPTVKDENGATEQRHRFKLKRPATLLRIVIQDDAGAGIASKRYRLVVGTETFNGTTPADGKVEHPIPDDALAATLELWLKDEPGIDALRVQLDLGALEHESKDRACQARLVNLAFDCGRIDGTVDDPTKAAVRGFQRKQGLTANGNLDAATRDRLRQRHEGA